MNEAEQQLVLDELEAPFGVVKLRCDGYEVSAVVQQIKPMRWAIAIYVNGEISGQWCLDGDERATKFFRETQRFLYPKKEREAYARLSKKKGFSAEYRRRLKEAAGRKVSRWYPYWTCGKAFLRHIKTSCKRIELVSIGWTRHRDAPGAPEAGHG